ncbi:MAG: helix-turn-helix domain-containing protein [Phycisphaerales bacterium]|nr:helix-turn-helix domain-containing protein [Phycisphaerales bacterium]
MKKSEPTAIALRPRDAARALGVSERTLWEWTKAGTIPHRRIGGCLLYPVAALERWINQQGNGQGSKP